MAALFVILSRFELLTSCLSSKRSKPTELKDQYFHCKDIKNDAKRNDPFASFFKKLWFIVNFLVFVCQL